MVNITELIQGEKVRLVDFGSTSKPYRQRLLSLGLTLGTEIVVIRFAPLGCPIQVDVRGTQLALRKEEACDLKWERL